MILGTGIDLMDPARMERAAEKSEGRILDRLFTMGEQAYCKRRRDQWLSFAARFAAKEAFVKALGLGIRQGLAWNEIEVVNNEWGRPDLVLKGKAAEIVDERGINSIHLSLSHQKGMAIASVILEGESP
jgi:holo-[acyl-carrier protein] synthase